MKKTLLLSCFIFVSAGLSAQKKTDAQAANLKGVVKSMTTTNYRMFSNPGKPPSKVLMSKFVNNYDKLGNCTEMIIYDNKGAIDAKCTPKKDPATNTESLIYYKGGKVDRKSVRQSDMAAHTSDLKVYNGTGAIESHYKELINDKGDPLESTQLDPKGGVARKYLFEYDANGNKTIVKAVAADGSVETVDTNRYNSDNDLIEWVINDVKGPRSNHYIFKYEHLDKGGNWLTKKQMRINAAGPDQVTERKITYHQ